MCQARNYLNLDLHKQRQIFNTLPCLNRHLPPTVKFLSPPLLVVSSQILNIQQVNALRNNVIPF